VAYFRYGAFKNTFVSWLVCLVEIDPLDPPQGPSADLEVGLKVGQWTVPTDSEGHLQLLRWTGQFEEVEFALEDCRHLPRCLPSLAPMPRG
jgi:hypothetical protein